jgi:hypothetical protein
MSAEFMMHLYCNRNARSLSIVEIMHMVFWNYSIDEIREESTVLRDDSSQWLVKGKKKHQGACSAG